MGVLGTTASIMLSTYHNLGISGTEDLLGILSRPDEVLLDVSYRQKGKTSVLQFSTGSRRITSAEPGLATDENFGGHDWDSFR